MWTLGTASGWVARPLSVVAGEHWGAGLQEHLLCAFVKPGQPVEVGTVVPGPRTESLGPGRAFGWRQPEVALGSTCARGRSLSLHVCDMDQEEMAALGAGKLRDGLTQQRHRQCLTQSRCGRVPTSQSRRRTACGVNNHKQAAPL